MGVEMMNKNIKVELKKGVSKKTNKPYVMLKITTGVDAVDRGLKPIFLTELQVYALEMNGIKID